VIILANRDFLVNSFGENILNLSAPLSLAKGSSHRTDMAGGTIMYISEESAAVARKTVKCHPERICRIRWLDEEDGKLSSE